jgi:hypothetical protein
MEAVSYPDALPIYNYLGFQSMQFNVNYKYVLAVVIVKN